MFKKGLIWIGCGYGFNLLETWFFGWNATAQSGAEKFCDGISIGIIAVGLSILIGYTAGKTIISYLSHGTLTIITEKIEGVDQ